MLSWWTWQENERFNLTLLFTIIFYMDWSHMSVKHGFILGSMRFFAMVGLYQCFVWSECWVNWLECYSFSNKRWKPMRYDHPKYWHEYAFLSSIESPENQEPTSKTRFPLSDKLPFLTSMWSALMRSSEPSHNFSPPEPQKQAHGFTISHLCQPLQHITKTIII